MPTPRFPEVEEGWANEMRQSYEKLLEEHLAKIPKALPEREMYAWHAVANDYYELACILYASGEPLDSVRASLASCARAHLEVVKRRGTGDVSAGRGYTPPKEYATGNSRSTYLAICMALIVGDFEVARSLSPLVWDPPDASYVAPNSVICTASQQALAYAMKYILLDNQHEAEKELQRLTRVTEEEVGEMLMLRGIIAVEPARIFDGLSRTLAWHASVATDKQNYRVVKYFLCIPALGLSALALQRELMVRTQLPENNDYCPRDLIVI